MGIWLMYSTGARVSCPSPILQVGFSEQIQCGWEHQLAVITFDLARVVCARQHCYGGGAA